MSAASSNLPARAGFLSGVRSYRPRRTFSAPVILRCIAAAAALVFVAAAVSLFGCHPLAAKSARPIDFVTPNPDIPKFYTHMKQDGLASGPREGEPADVRELAAVGHFKF